MVREEKPSIAGSDLADHARSREHAPMSTGGRKWGAGLCFLGAFAVVGLPSTLRAQANQPEKAVKPASGDVTSPAKSEAEAAAPPVAKPSEETTEEGTPPALDPAPTDPVIPTEEEVVEKNLERQRDNREKWLKENPSRELPKKADVFTLTVSGGVSLGSYEAGLLHLLTESLRRSPDSAKLKIVTGASAGSANALIAGTEACLKEVEEPENSLGYKAWVSVGLDDLFVPDRVTQHAMFVRDGLDRGYGFVADRMKEGLPKDCDFAIGVTTTREKGYEVHLSKGLVVPRVAERFAVHVTGRGDKVAPVFYNYLDPSQNFERPVLPLSDGEDLTGARDLGALREVILASAAFPVAFQPQTIEHCTTARRNEDSPFSVQKPPQCEVATRIDTFIDGGVFDNTPLGLATEIATSGLVESTDGPVFRPVPTGGEEPQPQTVFGYIDPDLRNYPLYEEPQDQSDAAKNREDPLISLLAKLGGQAISGARGRELATLAETNPEALSRLWLMESSYPPISELLAAFFGFFEKDFRDFDFHLGSYESYRDLRDHSGSMLGVEPFLDQLAEYFQGNLKDVPRRYQKLGCILAHVEPDRYARLAPLCEGKNKRNFRALLQVTINRLWSNCRRLAEKDTAERDHLQCKRAQGGLPAPLVDPSFASGKGKSHYQAAGESELDYVMRLLGAYGFVFRDLGLKPSESHLGRRAVRRRLADMVTALSDAQKGFGSRTTVLTLGRTLVNSIEYEPPEHRGLILLGGALDFGYLGRITENPAWYWNPDIRVNHLRSLISDRPNQFGGTASFGVELAILPLSGKLLQTSVALRGGYQFEAVDAIGFDSCPADEVASDSRLCSQPVIHIPLNLTLLERIRFTAIPMIYPLSQPWGHKVVDFEMAIGGELF